MALFDAAIGVFPLGDERDDRIGGVGLKLGAVGVCQARHMAGVFDGGDLHAQANAQVRHFVFTRKTGRANLAFDTALAKTTGHQDRVKARQLLGVVWR